MKVKAAADKMVNGSKLCESAEEVNMSLSDAIEKVGTVMGHTNCALDIRREFIECIERDSSRPLELRKVFSVCPCTPMVTRMRTVASGAVRRGAFLLFVYYKIVQAVREWRRLKRVC
ncbi:hypothetical protein ERJ75_001550100 [Trypanosoma vivax]|nr:hypothetical protein ERJ75_001550100 [Trypanosoma vivax]